MYQQEKSFIKNICKFVQNIKKDRIYSYKEPSTDGRSVSNMASVNLLSGYHITFKNVVNILSLVRIRVMAFLIRRKYLWGIISQQNRLIMTSGFDLNKAQQELENNPYYNKYAQKIQKLIQTDPEEFKRKLEAHEEAKKPKSDSVSTKNVIYGDKKGPSTTQTKQSKSLDEIMKTSMLVDKTKEEIINIWNEFHNSKEVIYGTLTSEVFDIVKYHSDKYPTFLLPLPRGEGYEFIVLQIENNEVHFTPLISYQTHKADAPECLTLVYYTDLKENKNVILMKGEFDKNILSIIEAQCLVNTLHLYYGEKNQKRENLMEIFTNNPEEFRFMDLVAEMESVPLRG